MDTNKKLQQENDLLRERFDKALLLLQNTKAELDRIKTLQSEKDEKSEEIQDDIIDLLGDGVLEINKYGAVVYYSKQLKSFFKKLNSQYNNIFSLLSRKDRYKLLRKVSELKSGRIIKEEISLVAGGQKHCFIVSVKPKVLSVNGKKKTIGAVALLTNISHQKAVENELIKAKEKALNATKVKSEFLSRMTHEIRTPIHAITNFTQVLLDSDPLNSQREYLEFIRFSSENLLTIVNDVLDFSKIEAGKMVFENKSFDIKNLLNTLYNIFRKRSEHKNLFFNLHFGPHFPQFVSGDSAKLTQVLSNLLSNAIKFTESGGIELSTSLIEETNEQYKLRFTVKDSGIGITKSKLKTVFKEFQQAEVYTNREYGGTGLGLTITKYFVELQKGTIWADSKKGEGSSFIFELSFGKPGAQEIKNISVPKTTKRRNMEGLKILVVEDNHLNRLVAEKILKKWKAEVDVAENGLKGSELAAKNDYDIILMDIEMPVMNGYEAAMEIRRFNKEIPIIALTASLLADVRKNSIRSGMNSFVSKPFTEGELWEAIKCYSEVPVS